MTKTEQQIERDFYLLFKQSALGAAIGGNVLRADEREDNAQGEDLTIKFLAGRDSQVQSGVVVVNIYVPDITNEQGRMVRNKPRIGELQALLLQVVEGNTDNDYHIETDGSPASQKVEGINQHSIFARIYFERLNV